MILRNSSGEETSEIAKKLAKVKSFPSEPEPRTDAWYRKRRKELQRQKVELLGKLSKKAA